MDITILLDSTTNQDTTPQGLLAKKGYSTHISYSGHNILVDLGTDDSFIRNAENLGINIGEVDICFITHGHYENCNGLKCFLEYNKTAKIYLSNDILGKYYNKDNKYIGADECIAKIIEDNKSRFVFVEDEYYIDNSVYIISGNDRRSIMRGSDIGYSTKTNHRMEPDDFHHELYIVIGSKEKIIVSSCTHKGIANLMYWTRFDNIVAFIGGIKIVSFDKNKARDIRYADELVTHLKEHKAKYYVHNCVNVDFYEYLQKNLGDKFQQLYLGSRLHI